MGRRFLLLWLLLVASLAPAGCSATTPTEAAAIAAAKLDHTAYTLPPDKLAKAIVLNHFFDLLLLVRTAWGLVSLWLLLQLGMAAHMRNFALRFSNNIWLQAVTFTAMFLALWLLLRLPLNMLGHWKSVQYGFSVQTWASWFGDIGKNWLLNVALYASGAMLLFWVMRRSPRRWWLWLWFPTVVISLFLAALEPMLIAPLFDHYEPLAKAHPALVQQLEAVANHGGISIPPDRMYLMKASEKSTLMNAEVTGFGSSKRLVLYDTLLDKSHTRRDRADRRPRDGTLCAGPHQARHRDGLGRAAGRVLRRLPPVSVAAAPVRSPLAHPGAGGLGRRGAAGLRAQCPALLWPNPSRTSSAAA